MKEKLKTLQLIHLALCAGLIIVYLSLGELDSLDRLGIPNIDSSNMIYLFLPVVAFVLSQFMFKSQLKKIDSKLSLEDKIPFYQTASIIRWAILEGAAFFVLVVQDDFIVLGLAIILYLIFLRPTENGIKNDLNTYN